MSPTHARAGAIMPRYVAAVGTTYDSVISALSPACRYKFDDTSGTDAAEASGGPVGTYANTPTLGVAGLVSDGGKAVTLDGNTQEMFAPGAGGLSTIASLASPTAGSVVLWFKTTDNAIIWRDHTSSSGTGWFINLSGTNISARIAGSDHTTTTASSGYKNGARHMCALTTDGSTVKLYMDGTQIDSWARTATFSNMTSAGPIHIARNGTNNGTTNYYAMTADDLAIFAAELTATNISDLWNAGK